MKKVLALGLLIGAAVLVAACIPLAKPEKSGIRVVTNGVDSTVYLNDNYLDKTPTLNQSLSPGTYTLKIQPNDPEYVPYETTVKLHPGSLTVVTWNPSTRIEYSGGIIFEMEPIRSSNTAEISVVTIPDGAIIKLGEGDKEFAPFIFQNVQPGQHELEIMLPSYEVQQHTLDVPTGFRLLVNVKLAKQLNPADTSEKNITAPEREEDTSEPATSSAMIARPRVQIQKTGFFNNGQEVLRVRDAAGLVGKELGFAPVGSWYQYLNETNAGWLKINFNNQVGWVSQDYALLEN